MNAQPKPIAISKPIVSTMQAYSLYSMDSPRRVNFISRFMLDDKKTADKLVFKKCKKLLGRAPSADELVSVKTSINRTLAVFDPTAKDDLIPFGRKFMNYFALSCSVVSVAFIAMGVKAAKELSSNVESLVYFGVASLYPAIPAVVASINSFGNWKSNYRELAKQLDAAILSALKP